MSVALTSSSRRHAARTRPFGEYFPTRYRLISPATLVLADPDGARSEYPRPASWGRCSWPSHLLFDIHARCVNSYHPQCKR